MKIFVIVLVLLLGYLVYTLVSGNSNKTAGGSKKQPAQAEAVSKTQPSAQTQQPTQPKGSTVADEVNGVINYGIGATQLKAKQRSESKLSNIKKNHDQQLNKALAE